MAEISGKYAGNALSADQLHLAATISALFLVFHLLLLSTCIYLIPLYIFVSILTVYVYYIYNFYFILVSPGIDPGYSVVPQTKIIILYNVYLVYCSHVEIGHF
jgi:hypothetical protein